MKRLLLILLLVSLPACASNPQPLLTPAGVSAVQKTKVIQTLDLLRDSAITANGTNVLSTATTRKVVIAHEAAINIVNAAAQGWQAQLTILINALLPNLPASESAILTPLINAVIVSLQ